MAFKKKTPLNNLAALRQKKTATLNFWCCFKEDFTDDLWLSFWKTIRIINSFFPKVRTAGKEVRTHLPIYVIVCLHTNESTCYLPWVSKGVLPLRRKKNDDPPSSIQNDPHPLRNGFLTPYPNFELFKLATFFFLRKKEYKKNLEKKFFSPSDACTCFRPEKSKSAIKNVSPAPLSTPLSKIFMTPPPAIFYDPLLVAPKSLHTYVCMLHICLLRSFIFRQDQ